MANDLLDLVQSLTKTEKRHLKLRSKFHEGEKRYMRLFEILDTGEVYNSVQLQKLWDSEGYGGSLPVTKNYLYEFILSSLEHYYAQTRGKANIQALLKRVDILFDKALYKQCAKLLAKARKLANNHQAHRLLLEVLIWELRLLLNPQYKGELSRSLEELFEEEQSILNAMIQVNQARKYRFQTETFTASHIEDIDHWITLTDKPFVLCEFERSKAVYYKNNGMMKEALEAMDREIAIVEGSGSPMHDKSGFSKYLSALGAALDMSQQAGLLNKAEQYLEKLNPELREKQFAHSGHFQTKLFVSYYIHYLYQLVLLKDTLRTLALLNKIELDRGSWHAKLQWQILDPLLYLMAVAYHGIGNSAQALKTVNELIAKTYKRENERLVLDSLWLQIVLHFEKNNADTAEHLLEALQRRLKKSNATEGFDRKLVKLFQALLAGTGSEGHGKLFNRFLKAKVEWPVRKWLFNFKEWMEGRA